MADPQARLVSIVPAEEQRVNVTVNIQADQLAAFFQNLMILGGGPVAIGGTPQNSWDTQASPPGSVSENGQIVCKTGSAGWNSTAIATHSVLRFGLEILSTPPSCHVMIGFANKANFFHSHPSNFSRCGYFLYAANWGKYSCRGDSNATYHAGRSAMKAGDQVEVVYDRPNSQISFIVNGCDQGVAYNGVTGDLYPCVDIHDQGISVRFF